MSIKRTYSDYGGRWVGITHKRKPKRKLKKWAKKKCPKGRHLFDEVLGSGGDPFHYLHCDACELMIPIEGVINTYVNNPVIKEKTQHAHNLSREQRVRLGYEYEEDKR